MFNRPKITVIPETETECEVIAEGVMYGKTSMKFPLNGNVLGTRIKKWQDEKSFIQVDFSDLGAVHREFLLSGMPAEIQKTIFAEHEEDDDWNEEYPKND